LRLPYAYGTLATFCASLALRVAGCARLFAPTFAYALAAQRKHAFHRAALLPRHRTTSRTVARHSARRVTALVMYKHGCAWRIGAGKRRRGDAAGDALSIARAAASRCSKTLSRHRRDGIRRK